MVVLEGVVFMFFKFLKKQSLKILLLTLSIIPNIAFAYSEYIIASGKSVGMRLDTDGIIIAGSYEINGHNSLVEAGLKAGDIINQINEKEVNSVKEMVATDIEYKVYNMTGYVANKEFDKALAVIKDMMAKIDTVDMKEQKLNVLVDLFGQETSVEVDIAEVETM